MKKMNQIEQTEYIKNEFSTYLKSVFNIRDKTYNSLYRKRLEEIESKLYKGPYLYSMLPFEQSKTVNELMADGILDENFKKIGNLDFDRPCYAHQVQAFEKIRNKRNVVITTGTGSGKTECFMYPIIDELIREIKNNDTESGVRAIFLFPLNALVYDQVERLRNLLTNIEDIRFGFYTGRTPEDDKTNEGKRLINLYKEKYGEPAKNELLTREQMRSNPPQILFTNYSMLEYLIIRPSDESIISKDALSHLKFIVLDEAHIYRGALGIEISLLLRRLTGVAGKKPQFVLTSATLGKGKEDLDRIINYASNLTSSKYNQDDIVFGIRHNNNFECSYSIALDDYNSLYDNIDNIDVTKNIINKYINYNDQYSFKKNLYELLIRDNNTYILYHKTKNVCEFNEVLKSLDGFDARTLTSLIELISFSISSDNKYPLKLFDIKYHMFLKAPDGAFITISDKKDLSLITTNKINDDKTFKIGICQNCKEPYIMGITEDGRLCIDDEIDIDETYDSKAKKLEYYLIKDCLNDDEISDIEANDNFEKYEICSKCGYIKKANSAITTSDCEHFNSNKKILYKFIGKNETNLDDDDIYINNIHRCPICDYSSTNNGVIMGFHVGKDRATSLISQILYESMNYPIKRKIESPEESLSLFKKEKKIEYGPKQFLVFSDSRQQAAFFSKFLNSNNEHFLYKVMILDILKQNEYQTMSYLRLVEKLEKIYQNEFHFDEVDAIKYSRVAALWELLLVDGRNSGEGIGLFAYTLRLPDEYFDNNIEVSLKGLGFNISAQQFRDATCQTLNVFRMNSAIKYDSLMCDYEEKKELLSYRGSRTKYYTLKDVKHKSDSTFYPVKSFLPVEDDNSKKTSVNNSVKYIMKAFDLDIAKAKELLTLIFNCAKDSGLLIKNTERPEYDNTYLINANSYDLHSYKNLKYYKCQKCNKLTLYNINNQCTDADCNGELVECLVDDDIIYKNNYYRNEYLKRPMERLICKEHTAQMNVNQAKEIQDEFKEGKINFISCSTTFEMGIDLGNLNTVFLRNVPPTPANYAQRAGRAGRRADTSAFILTFCGTSSHDYSFFSNPSEMIKGLVNPPYFVVDNDKILIRHITATALALFFREKDYSECFNTVDYFINEDVKNKFINYIKSKPKKLGDVIDNYLLGDERLLNKYGNYKWIELIEESESSLNRMIIGLQNEKDMYKQLEEQSRLERRYDDAKMYSNALERLNTPNSLITNFTKYNVIPSYGFPVDNVEFYIYNYEKKEMDDNYNLSRNLSLAISEYAPDSEIIVDNKKYTSRYIHVPRNDLPQIYYCECEKCHSINTSIDKNYYVEGIKCKYCNTTLNISGDKVQRYLTPIHGFVADRKNKETRRIKPFKTYAGDTYYVGDHITADNDQNDVVKVIEYKNEKLLILNENNFYYCPYCGFTRLKRRMNLPTLNEKHKTYLGKECQRGGKLELIHLGYSYETDIIKMSFRNIREMFDEDIALSVLYAVLEGISKSYDIERNDIGGIIFRTNIASPYSLILFDTVAGGAGHVKRLKDEFNRLEVFKTALEKVSQDCCDEDTSCYNCLKNYSNQKLHKHLKRGLARKALTSILYSIQNKRTDYEISKPSISFNNVSIDDFMKNDYLEDEDSKRIFSSLVSEIKLQKTDLPDGFGYKITDNEDKKYTGYCDFVWQKQGLLLFTINNQDSYNALVNSQSKYSCFLLTESFDYINFVKYLKGE